MKKPKFLQNKTARQLTDEWRELMLRHNKLILMLAEAAINSQGIDIENAEQVKQLLSIITVAFKAGYDTANTEQ